MLCIRLVLRMPNVFPRIFSFLNWWKMLIFHAASSLYLFGSTSSAWPWHPPLYVISRVLRPVLGLHLWHCTWHRKTDQNPIRWGGVLWGNQIRQWREVEPERQWLFAWLFETRHPEFINDGGMGNALWNSKSHTMASHRGPLKKGTGWIERHAPFDRYCMSGQPFHE